MIENDQENDQHREIHTKDWFGPAIASMARLNQIQANVHNMGFHSASSLKASRSVKHRAKPPLPTDISSRNTSAAPVLNWEEDAIESQNIKDNPISYTALESTPPLSTASYQCTAWGSDHSIPELVAQQGRKMTKLRPSSAKGQTSKLKQSSRGRPQSAKEPLCSERNEKNVEKIAVCGLKKNLSNTRPPSRGSVPSPNVPMPNGGAWAGLPPGHVIEPACRMQDEGITPPIAPPSSPSPEDESREVEFIDSCPQTPPLLRRPLPQPIHLSLPSVSDSVDAIRDDCQPAQDDMDTQRLLVQADLFVDQQKMKEKEQDETVKNLISCNTTLPDHNDIDKIVRSRSTDISVEGMDSKGVRINVSDRGQPKNNFHSRNKQKCSMFLTPDDNIERSYQPLTLVEESRSDKTRVKSAPMRCNKESVNSISKTGVRIREDRNVTVDITPRNVGRKVNDVSTSSPHERHNKSNSGLKKQDAQISDKKVNRNLVSMINVEYQTDDDAVDSNSSNGKVKGKKNKTMKEVETMVSHLSKLTPAEDDTESTDDILLMSQVLHTSEGEKNYYEISRSQSRQSISSTSDSDMRLEKDANAVYKTTKTMEFDTDKLKENSTKLPINSHVVTQSKLSGNQKPLKYPSTILPSTIKQQKIGDNQHKNDKRVEREDPVKDMETKENMETGIDELTTMLNEAKLMAVSSLYDANKRRPPSGKKVTQRPKSGLSEQKSKLRPSSAGSKLHSATDLSKEKRISEKSGKSYPNYMTKTGSSNCCRSHKSARPSKPVVIKSIKHTIPFETPESDHCRKVQSRMAELGVDVDPRVLEKALFAPAGESLYYEVPGNLPKNPSEGLLSHYKYWLSEDYKRIQTMEKRLAQDDHIRYLQKLAAEKKAKKAAAKESKGKKKKKSKLVRSNSIV